MTTQEAIRRLKGLRLGLLPSNKEALAMAIQALEAKDRMEQYLAKLPVDTPINQ